MRDLEAVAREVACAGIYGGEDCTDTVHCIECVQFRAKILATLEAERRATVEACEKVVCAGCREGHPLQGNLHRAPGRVVCDSEPALPYSLVECRAAAIRALAPEGT